MTSILTYFSEFAMTAYKKNEIYRVPTFVLTPLSFLNRCVYNLHTVVNSAAVTSINRHFAPQSPDFTGFIVLSR
jgi:hypothetical protein